MIDPVNIVTAPVARANIVSQPQTRPAPLTEFCHGGKSEGGRTAIPMIALSMPAENVSTPASVTRGYFDPFPVFEFEFGSIS
jgi:hypothetical protein